MEKVFTLNEKEAYKYQKFIAKHKSCRTNVGATGGGYTIMFTPTGLGNLIVVKCDICGAEKNITDISCW